MVGHRRDRDCSHRHTAPDVTLESRGRQTIQRLRALRPQRATYGEMQRPPWPAMHTHPQTRFSLLRPIHAQGRPDPYIAVRKADSDDREMDDPDVNLRGAASPMYRTYKLVVRDHVPRLRAVS